MATKTNNESHTSLFCLCGGVWTIKDQNAERVLICPICGTLKSIPSDTSMFQFRFK